MTTSPVCLTPVVDPTSRPELLIHQLPSGRMWAYPPSLT